jgi:hypothetical protein
MAQRGDNRTTLERRLDRAFGGRGKYKEWALLKREEGYTVANIHALTCEREDISIPTLNRWISKWSNQETNDGQNI